MYPIKSKCEINKNKGNCELTLSPGGPLGPGGPSSPCRENALVNMAVFWINNTTSTSSVYFWVRLITSPWVQACQENHLLHARPWAPLETQDYNLDVILAKLVPAKSIFQAYHQPRGTNDPTVYQPKHFFLKFACGFCATFLLWGSRGRMSSLELASKVAQQPQHTQLCTESHSMWRISQSNVPKPWDLQQR